jgi:inhibitor of cysteine peptidase
MEDPTVRTILTMTRLRLLESSVRIQWTGVGRRAKVNVSSIHRTIGCLFVGLGLWYPLYARNPKMIQVDRSYNEREVTLAIGEVVEISLAENRTTGFHWELRTKPEPACSLVKSWFEPGTGPPGKGGTHRWQFQAVRSGTGEIKLEYRRPWEQETPPGQTFKLSVHVRKESTTPDSTTRSE